MLAVLHGRAMLALLRAEKPASERKNTAGQHSRSKRARAISSLASAENMLQLPGVVLQRAIDSRTRSSFMQRTISSERVETPNRRYNTLK